MVGAMVGGEGQVIGTVRGWEVEVGAVCRGAARIVVGELIFKSRDLEHA